MILKLFFACIWLAAISVVSARGKLRRAYGESVTRHAMQHWKQVEKDIEARHPLVNLKARELDRLNKRMEFQGKKKNNRIAEGVQKLFDLGRFN